MAEQSTKMIALLLTVAVSCVSSGSLPCDQSQYHVKECLKSLEGYEYEMTNAIVPTMEPTALKEHCRRYDEFENCMSSIRPLCNQWDQLHYEGIEAYYQFLCHDGFDMYVKYRECFIDDRLYREGDACNHTFVNSQLGLLESGYLQDTEYIKDRLCQYTNQYVDCGHRVVESFCGAEAAKWQRQLEKSYYSGLLEVLGCPFDMGKYTIMALTLGILVPLALVILIVIAIMLLVRQKKRRRRASQAASGTNNNTNTHRGARANDDAPPAYSGLYMVYNPTAQSLDHQAGSLPRKEPSPGDVAPPYEAPPYDSLSHTTGPARDGAVAAGYFGVNSDLSSQPTMTATNEGIDNPLYTSNNNNGAPAQSGHPA